MPRLRSVPVELGRPATEAERRPVADDEDEWDEDDYASVELEALEGAVELDEGSADVLSELLLDLTLGVARLNVLLSEADEHDFKAVQGRYKAFADALNKLPTSVRPRGQIGFKVGKTRRAKK